MAQMRAAGKAKGQRTDLVGGATDRSPTQGKVKGVDLSDFDVNASGGVTVKTAKVAQPPAEVLDGHLYIAARWVAGHAQLGIESNRIVHHDSLSLWQARLCGDGRHAV